jgi:putative component of toxin-antitoxin plasmid stabilization module
MKRKPIFVLVLPQDTDMYTVDSLASKLRIEIGKDYYVLVFAYGSEMIVNLYGEVQKEEIEQIEKNIKQWVLENQK